MTDRNGTGPVRVERSAEVATVWLDRPGVRNAVDLALASGLERALADLDDDVRVVVVRGAGGDFSVGGDFREVARLRSEGTDALRPLFETFGRALSSIAELPVPVVAAVEGYAMAGGFELVQACDIALVRDDAVLADNHLNFGQVPGGGGSQRLARLVGPQRALGHILTGDRMSGTEAVAWGLAYRAAPADRFEAALSELTSSLVDKDPLAVARAKRLVRRGLERPLAAGLAAELDAVVAHLGHEAAGAGIDRFERRGEGSSRAQA